jgi:hypothetical protein
MFGLLKKAQRRLQEEENKFATFRLVKDSKAGSFMKRWLRDQKEMFEKPSYEVACEDEGFGQEEDVTNDLGEKTGITHKTGKTPAITQGGKNGATAAGAATAIMANPVDSASAKVEYEGAVLYVKTVKSHFEVFVALGNDRSREWAVQRIQAVCAAGEKLLEEDRRNTAWVNYRFAKGSDQHEWFFLWLQERTEEETKNATDVVVELEGQKSESSEEAMMRWRQGRPKDSSDADVPPNFRYGPDRKQNVKTTMDFAEVVGEELKPVVVLVAQQEEEEPENPFGLCPPPRRMKNQDVTVHIKSLNKEVMELILKRGCQLANVKKSTSTSIYMTTNKHCWELISERPNRSINSVVLDEMPGAGGKLKNRYLYDDAKEFLETREWYMERGFPYKRGYLLEGLPGTGKTSVVTALAGELGLPIYMLNLNLKDLDAHGLVSLMKNTQQRSIILLEDVDAVFNSTEQDKNEGQNSEGKTMSSSAGAGGEAVEGNTNKMGGRSKATIGQGTLTLDALLNALDGNYAQEGRLVFMTTNCVEKLDAALIRPGRVDVRVSFGIAEQNQVKRLYTQFYSPASTNRLSLPTPTRSVSLEQRMDMSSTFAKLVQDKWLSHKDLSPVKKTAVEVQRYLMYSAKKDASAALEHIDEHVQQLLKDQGAEKANEMSASPAPTEKANKMSALPASTEVMKSMNPIETKIPRGSRLATEMRKRVNLITAARAMQDGALAQKQSKLVAQRYGTRYEVTGTRHVGEDEDPMGRRFSGLVVDGQ